MKKLIILLLVIITSISCINAVEYQEGQTYKQGSITFKITHITINDDGTKQYELEVLNRQDSRVDKGINYVNNTASINKGEYKPQNNNNTVKVPMQHTGTNWGVIIVFLLISALVLGHSLKAPKH